MTWGPAMRIAYLQASYSEDPSTQNGAVVFDKYGSQLGVGYNGPTRGVKMSDEDWADRDAKLAFVEHAERTAIFNSLWSAERLVGATMVAVWASCADCARAIVSSGITTLVRHAHPPTKWDASIAQGDQILRAGGVHVVTLHQAVDKVPLLRFNGGQVWDGSKEMCW